MSWDSVDHRKYALTQKLEQSLMWNIPFRLACAYFDRCNFDLRRFSSMFQKDLIDLGEDKIASSLMEMTSRLDDSRNT